MIKSLIFSFLRNLVKNRISTFINVFGLVVSLTCCLIIYHKISYELSFDNYHTEAKTTYRIIRQTKGLGLGLERGEFEYRNAVYGALPSTIKDEIPELKKVVSVFPQGGLLVNVPNETSSNQTQQFKVDEEGAVFTEPSYFEVFDFNNTSSKWIYGSPSASLSEPFTVVLSQQLAEKFFGNEHPIGKSLTIYNQPCKVTGLISAPPVNTDFPFQMFVSYSSIEKMDANFSKNWGNLGNLECYVVLNNSSQIALVEEKIKNIHTQHVSKEIAENRIFKLQSLADIHHDTRFTNFNYRTVSKQTLITLGCIGLFLMIMACANYANLSLARSRYRAREVGVRKILGGKRWHLVLQLFGESVLLTTLSTVFALILSYLFIILFSSLLGIPLNYSLPFNLTNVLALTGLIFVVSALSSSYPSLLLSASQPVDLIKKTFEISKKGVAIFTRSMVIVQFTISLLMIMGTITVFRQYQFLINSDLGFDKEAVFNVPIPARDATLMKRFKSTLLENSAIKSISFSNSHPARSSNWGSAKAISKGAELKVETQMVVVDTSYAETYGLKLMAGSNLNLLDSSKNILINEELAKQLNFNTPDEAIGKEVMFYYRKPNARFRISGVVKDYHYESFYTKIRPTILLQDPNRTRIAGIKIVTNSSSGDGNFKQIQDVLAYVENSWKSIFPNEYYEFEFIEDRIKNNYASEASSSKLINIFALITVIISCLGIFGLALYSSEQRSKEIGIRKINGAKVSEVMVMLNGDLVKWVAIAFIIACPIALYAMNKWLENFAYKTTLSWWIFALAGLLALGIALLTVSWQSWRAATRNPVEALRYE
ncbi:MAG: FtsX-like permease family protein [Prolixibacteraceae bacterium]|jgi:putative ABC transport system permease protein|nr:FtsX-like permease family protein [Prolixibacteraceae bacterium]MBT6005137.1 FtsX-like permease family protein [Prolixibacteraceae bacterium]MBT6766952.1 FtsX-like permease family protein [Prolixibacteraceae bacterium]MBT6997980.1 FtsX-like permease family protein [Prolixibacteraceae bacterium]MBT7396010.1 FtsX-like permease family protein [Prolixibacteraceae bacterium]